MRRSLKSISAKRNAFRTWKIAQQAGWSTCCACRVPGYLIPSTANYPPLHTAWSHLKHHWVWYLIIFPKEKIIKKKPKRSYHYKTICAFYAKSIQMGYKVITIQKNRKTKIQITRVHSLGWNCRYFQEFICIDTSIHFSCANSNVSHGPEAVIPGKYLESQNQPSTPSS